MTAIVASCMNAIGHIVAVYYVFIRGEGGGGAAYIIECGEWTLDPKIRGHNESKINNFDSILRGFSPYFHAMHGMHHARTDYFINIRPRPLPQYILYTMYIDTRVEEAGV